METNATRPADPHADPHAGQVARRAIALMDLTELSDDATLEAVRRLCMRSRGPHGHVAAVCVWPKHVGVAVELLAGSDVRVATVVNFPHGTSDIDTVVEQTRAAIAAGADEIDVVIPWRALLDGNERHARELLVAVRDACAGHTMKTILESGHLGLDVVERAAQLAVECGTDFVKTSTGKTARSATVDAVSVMLDVIARSERPIGLKPSGGIRTVADAAAYLELADSKMGPDWATSRTFRFGASGLLDNLLAVIDGTDQSVASTY